MNYEERLGRVLDRKLMRHMSSLKKEYESTYASLNDETDKWVIQSKIDLLNHLLSLYDFYDIKYHLKQLEDYEEVLKIDICHTNDGITVKLKLECEIDRCLEKEMEGYGLYLDYLILNTGLPCHYEYVFKSKGGFFLDL